jgi:hypothetical protein
MMQLMGLLIISKIDGEVVVVAALLYSQATFLCVQPGSEPE